MREVIAATGRITTIAGTGQYGYSGDKGPATSAKLANVTGVAVDANGNVYLADWDANVVRKVDAKTSMITTIGGTGTFGYSGDGAPATSAKMDPYGLAIDASGSTLYLTEPIASTIRKIDLTSGTITIVAGQAGQYGFAGDNGTAFSAVFWGPYGVAVDSARNLVVCDTLNQRVRKIASVSGVVSTVAGTNNANFLNHPEGISLDAKGILNVADTGNNAAKQIDVSSGAVNALPLYYTGTPEAVGEDSAGNLYISSEGFMNWYVYRYNAQYSYFAGNGTNGYSGDNALATQAKIGQVTGLAVDSSNNVYMTDYTNSRVRKIDSTDIFRRSPETDRKARRATAARQPRPAWIHSISPWTNRAICTWRTASITASVSSPREAIS